MSEKEKISECPAKLKTFIREANYLLSDDIKMEHPATVNLEFTMPERRKIFSQITGQLENECFEDYPWLKKVLDNELRTLDLPFLAKMDKLKAKNRSENQIQRCAWQCRDEIERGYWVELEIGENWGAARRPYKDLWSIIQKATARRKAFLEIIELNSYTPMLKEELGLQVREEFTGVKIIDGVIIPIILDPVFDYVIIERIDTRRISKCPVCFKIIWKKQITAGTCGEKKCVQKNKYLKTKNIKVYKVTEISERRIVERQRWLNKDFSLKGEINVNL